MRQCLLERTPTSKKQKCKTNSRTNSWKMLKDAKSMTNAVGIGTTLQIKQTKPTYPVYLNVQTAHASHTQDEFLRLVDRRTGAEEVVVGPAAVSPALEDP